MRMEFLHITDPFPTQQEKLKRSNQGAEFWDHIKTLFASPYIVHCFRMVLMYFDPLHIHLNARISDVKFLQVSGQNTQCYCLRTDLLATLRFRARSTVHVLRLSLISLRSILS